MIATRPTQEQVDQIARELAPDVLRIRMNITRDWSDDPAIYFRVTLSDEAAQGERLHDTTRRVRKKVVGELRLSGGEHFPYFRFRTKSEQAQLRDPQWE